VQKGLRPEDVLVTALTGDKEKGYSDRLERCLGDQGLTTWRPGSDWESVEFRRPGCVTLANIFRAKGNEAWKVYAARFHCATAPLEWRGEEEVHKRNQAFVALTRARLWCVVTGLDGPVFEELRRAIGMAPQLAFPAFNRRTLRRVTDEEGGDGRDVPVA
jgi:superfamily I DNA and RNA helicase